jgi:DNA-binding NarL/FixJ family response regulator
MKQPARKTRLLIVDDHALVRSGIRHLLQPVEDVQVVGEARDGIEALQMVRELAPDVILLDMEMPVMNGVEVTRQLHAAKSPVHAGLERLRPFVHSGAAGSRGGRYLFRKAPAVVEAIHRLAGGEQGLQTAILSTGCPGRQSDSCLASPAEVANRKPAYINTTPISSLTYSQSAAGLDERAGHGRHQTRRL